MVYKVTHILQNMLVLLRSKSTCVSSSFCMQIVFKDYLIVDFCICLWCMYLFYQVRTPFHKTLIIFVKNYTLVHNQKIVQKKNRKCEKQCVNCAIVNFPCHFFSLEGVFHGPKTSFC